MNICDVGMALTHRIEYTQAKAKIIAAEEAECKEIADSAERDLGVALPALHKALEEVDKLDKSSVSEVKAYSKPPPAVEMVLSAVMILFGGKTDWASAKKKIGESTFLKQVKEYNKDAIPPSMVKKINKFTRRPEFTQESVAKVSLAASALCVWVRAMETYAVVFKTVEPKRKKLKQAMDTLAIKQESLKVAQADLGVLLEKVAKLQERYDTSVGEKNRLRQEAGGLAWCIQN